MPTTIIKIKTWKCGQCGYHQDFEPTQENQDLHFNSQMNDRLTNLKVNECPSCKLKKQVGTLVLEIDPDKKTTIAIMDKADVDTMTKDDTTQPKDAEGKFPQIPLTKSEKDEMTAKISADIIKFTALED